MKLIACCLFLLVSLNLAQAQNKKDKKARRLPEIDSLYFVYLDTTWHQRNLDLYCTEREQFLMPWDFVKNNFFDLRTGYNPLELHCLGHSMLAYCRKNKVADPYYDWFASMLALEWLSKKGTQHPDFAKLGPFEIPPMTRSFVLAKLRRDLPDFLAKTNFINPKLGALDRYLVQRTMILSLGVLIEIAKTETPARFLRDTFVTSLYQFFDKYDSVYSYSSVKVLQQHLEYTGLKNKVNPYLIQVRCFLDYLRAFDPDLTPNRGERIDLMTMLVHLYSEQNNDWDALKYNLLINYGFALVHEGRSDFLSKDYDGYLQWPIKDEHIMNYIYTKFDVNTYKMLPYNWFSRVKGKDIWYMHILTYLLFKNHNMFGRKEVLEDYDLHLNIMQLQRNLINPLVHVRANYCLDHILNYEDYSCSDPIWDMFDSYSWFEAYDEEEGILPSGFGELARAFFKRPEHKLRSVSRFLRRSFKEEMKFYGDYRYNNILHKGIIKPKRT